MTQLHGLYGAKDWFTRVLTPVINFSVRARLSPDLFTFVGIIGATFAAWGIVILDPLTTLAGLVVRLAGANLDGAVARARELDNPLGFFANELGDRISDFTVMLAFVLVAMQTLNLDAVLATTGAVFAAALPTAVSLIGYRLQKRVGLTNPVRLNGGPLAKTERCALAFLAVLAYGVTAPLVLVLLIFGWTIIVGSVVTAVLRAIRIRQLLLTKTLEN